MDNKEFDFLKESYAWPSATTSCDADQASISVILAMFRQHIRHGIGQFHREHSCVASHL